MIHGMQINGKHKECDMKKIIKKIAQYKHLFDVFVRRFFRRIGKFVELSKWFNRKSQHYIFDNWWHYLNYIDDYKKMNNYVKRYPIAYIKFMWYSRQDIKNA